LPSPIGADRVDDCWPGSASWWASIPSRVSTAWPRRRRGGSQPGHRRGGRAAHRSVYGLRLVRYTATPDTAAAELQLDAQEWSRKSAALAACDAQATPLHGQREYFGL